MPPRAGKGAVTTGLVVCTSGLVLHRVAVLRIGYLLLGDETSTTPSLPALVYSPKIEKHESNVVCVRLPCPSGPASLLI